MNISDIAKLAGVSSATVSRALNDSGPIKETTKQKILDIVEENHFIPNGIARSLSKKETNLIGIIVPNIINIFFTRVIEGITKIANQNGYNVVLCNTEGSIEKEKKYYKILSEQKARGILLISNSSTDMKELKWLKDSGMDIVLLDRELSDEYSGVYYDNEKYSYEMIKLFLETGLKDIVIITGNLNTNSGRDRFLGYKRAMEEFGLYNEQNVYKGDFNMQSGYKRGLEILKKDKLPELVFVSNNQMMSGFYVASNNLGIKIPEDVGAICFEESEALTLVEKGITSYKISEQEIGEKGMKILLEKFKDPNYHAREIMIGKLNFLNSVKAEKHIKK